jgi:hypothetical protein
VLSNVVREQTDRRRKALMSSVLWDMFTGSATYRDILLRTLRPTFMLQLATAIIASVFGRPIEPGTTEPDAVVASVGGDVEQI